MIFKSRKFRIFSAGICLYSFMTCNIALAATAGGVDIIAPVAMPAAPSAAPDSGTGTVGIDAAGTGSTSTSTPDSSVNFQNPNQFDAIDLTGNDSIETNSQNFTQQDPTQIQNTNTPRQSLIQTEQSNSAETTAEMSNSEIEQAFNEILESGQSGGNPMGNLIRRMPRFGMSFFRRPASTYAPRDSVPVTSGYRIGVGDEMVLTLWGIPEEGNFRFSVNRDGLATIPHIGAIRLAGYTIQEAERIIQARLNQYYTGYQMNLAMGRLSSIMIYVTGNARRPGAYTVSSFATLVNALLASGGPSSTGTLRRIELKRNGVTVTVFDMYAMLLQGDKSQDARLQAGDVIYIPPVGPLVGITGEVQRPGVYELNGATRVQDLLHIAGGLNAQMFRGRVQFYRIFEHAYASAIEGTFDQIQDEQLRDGDVIRLFPIYNLTSIMRISGPIIRPGTYTIVPGKTRIADIINRAGGLLVTASDRAEIVRVTPTLNGPENERIEINIAEALRGDPINNIALENNDQVTILVIPEYRRQIRVTIAGEVMRPGSYAMIPGERLSDLIERAGGFTSRAYLRGAVFTRRSVAVAQRRSLNQMADRMERDMLENVQNLASSGSATTSGASQAYNQEVARRRELINRLRHVDILGRVITKVDTPKNIIGTPWDYELQDGDYLGIQNVPLVVNVTGAVYSASTQVFRNNMSINGYINAAGGTVKSAHKRMLYLLKSDGTTIKLTRSTSMLSSKAWTPPSGYSATVEPGDTIIVPVKYVDRQSFEMFKDTIDIIYKIAVAAGVIVNAIKD